MELFDLLVIGAGPAGLSAAAHARAEGLDCVVLERGDHLADTVHCYQKRKYVMAEPGLVPLRGPLPFGPGSREEVLATWDGFAAEHDLRVDHGREVQAVERDGDGFVVRTGAGDYRARHVLLAVGTQGNPRRLGVPGEELDHVAFRLVDPDAHDDEDVVVVGAGDSALEVALALAERNRVHLVVRSEEIVRAKESLEREALARQQRDELTIHFRTTVKRVVPGFIDLNSPDGDLRVSADRLILKIGAEPPRKLLERCGVTFVSDARDARPRLDRHHQTETPGLYLVGAAAGRDLIKLGINQAYEAVEHILGREVEPADEAVLRERLPCWPGSVRERIETLRQRVPVLAAADPEQLREVFLLTEVHDYDDGATIVAQNDYTDSFLVITDGRVAISARGEDGHENRLAELDAGSFFGEMGLISGRRRNATATALGPCRILEIPRKAMVKLLHTAPAVKAMVDRTFLVRAIGSYLFPDVPEDALAQLAERARQERVGRDRPVFAEGDASDAFYLIRHGMVKLSTRSSDRELVLAYLGAGNYFGESALLDNAPRTATVTTIFDTDFIILERAAFEDFLAQMPHLRERLLADLKKKRELTLAAEARPGGGDVLERLIRTEAVIGTDVLLIDNHKCIRCGNCVAACESVHEDGQSRLSLTGSTFTNLLFPNSCMQCKNPLCMIDCPPDAIIRRPTGEIQILDTCIGCGNCAENCPYDNIFMVQPKPKLGPVQRLLVGLGLAAAPAPPEIKKEVAVKCDLCADLPGGPACVRSCPTSAAIRLGDEGLRERVLDLVAQGDEG